jgi:hypothetical protein
MQRCEGCTVEDNWYEGKAGPSTRMKQLSHAHIEGRAIAQAVSRLLPTAAARVQTLVWSCGIL